MQFYALDTVKYGFMFRVSQVTNFGMTLTVSFLERKRIWTLIKPGISLLYSEVILPVLSIERIFFCSLCSTIKASRGLV